MPEMILILAIALIVIGPKKLPDLAKSLGRAMNEFKKATREIKASMDIEDDLKDVKHSFDDLSADIKGQGKPKESGKADAAEPATAAAAPAPTAPSGPKTMSGMSILGNEEAPKSLVIVPWKSSKLGDGLGVENALDARPRAIDREVFMRELHYYELRSGESK